MSKDQTTTGWERYAGDVTLVWEGDEVRPPGIDESVVEDIRATLGDLSRPGDLITHHVKLTADWGGPSVHVYGVEGDPSFHCSYHSTTRWATIEEGAGDDPR